MGLLEGRVAVVTGSGRGIGRAIAVELAGQGAAVVVNDAGVSLDGQGGEDDPTVEVLNEIESAGGQAVASYDDVSKFDSAESIIETAVSKFGKIDILVNNAGIVRDRSLVKMSEEEFDAVVGVHMKGTFNCTRHAAPHMKEQGFGRIINITSSAGLRGNFGQTNYAAAKAGIAGMTFVWAIELAKYGITANAFAPVGATRMTSNIVPEGGADPGMDPSLNAPMIAFLASERAAHINGQVFGRRGFGYTIFQKFKPQAAMYKDGGWTAEEIADHFDTVLGEYMAPPGLDVTVKKPEKKA
ncbi:MAG TPA: SDR family NAD(P)-dependent oxidoreductase [Actinomycetota bacterium]|nr:SDR family NAD(P)-dependent oxidoreductase [Actinomycetota bacterium]